MYKKGFTPNYAYTTAQSDAACDALTNRVRMFSVGTRLSGTSIYFANSAGACTAVTPNSAYDYFPRGDEIPPSAFVAATWSVDP